MLQNAFKISFMDRIFLIIKNVQMFIKLEMKLSLLIINVVHSSVVKF